MSMSKPTFGYWDYRGLGNPIRLLLEYLEVDYEEVRYPSNALAGIQKWNMEKDELELEFPNIPYFLDGSLRLTESRAIQHYIARVYGNKRGKKVIPEEEEAALLAKVEMVEGVIIDAGYILAKRAVHDDDVFIKEIAKTAIPKLRQLDNFLRGKQYLMGDQIYYIDFIAYELASHFLIYDSNIMVEFSNLLKLKETIESLPEIQKYMNSPKWLAGPCYHPFFSSYKF